MYKEDLQFEIYLNKPKLSFNQRICLSKFRCGSNKMPINKRFSVDPNEKLCNLCNTGEIGNEYHYLFNCSGFLVERSMFLNRYFYTRPNSKKCTNYLIPNLGKL